MKEKIRELREQLDKLIVQDKVEAGVLLSLSVELDKLIVQYCRGR